MRIGLDYDDVVCNTQNYKQIYFRQKRGIVREVISRLTIVDGGDMNREEYLEFITQMYEDLEASVEFLFPNVDSITTINQLQSDGHTVEIITARSEKTLEVAFELNKRWGLNINVIGVGYRNTKVEAATGCNVYMDDDPKNLLQLLGIVPYLFIMTTEENKDFTDSRIIRVNNWQEFHDRIKYIEQ